MSAVGTWQLDVARSEFGPDPKPASLTLTILSDKPDLHSVRVDVVESNQNKASYQWSGPKDGKLYPVKSGDGQTIGQESMRNEGDVLVRHVESPDGETLDSRATLSADGNTITDDGVGKAADGKAVKTHSVYHRVTGKK
jgi:hypothetical protein